MAENNLNNTVEKKKATSQRSPSTKKVQTQKEDITLLLETIAQLKEEINQLKESNNKNVTSNVSEDSTKDITTILNAVVNSRSNKEIVIVHNIQNPEGLSTVINLHSFYTEMHNIGEQRTISWQQFEDLQSKYDFYFKRGVLLLGAGYDDIAESYGYKCYRPETGKFLTTKTIETSGDVKVEDLPDFYDKLDNTSQRTLLAFWLTKCYEKNPKFYDRYKLETLNRISRTELFRPLLSEMSLEDIKKR